jgi:tRNA (cytidine/uridine-2'-O-)-methyltransferase
LKILDMVLLRLRVPKYLRQARQSLNLGWTDTTPRWFLNPNLVIGLIQMAGSSSIDAMNDAAGRPTAGLERHVVLVEPEIHWNTGNIGRTCLGAGARLHLIHPIGFSLDSRQVRRAGLDYWKRVVPNVWESFDAFCGALTPMDGEMALFSKAGARVFWEMPACQRMFLVFGSETGGLSEAIISRYPRACYRIPISGEIRSLNLSTAAGIALYESIRCGK